MSRAWSATWRSLLFIVVGVLPAGLVPALGPRFGLKLNAPVGQLVLDAATLGSVLFAGWLFLRLERTRFSVLGFPRQHGFERLAVGAGVGSLWLLVTLGAAWLGRGLFLRPSGSLQL